VLNPVDVLGDAPADLYNLTLETVIRDPGVGGVLVIVTPQIMTEIRETARAVGELSRKSDKPIFACFMGQQRIQMGIDVLNQYAVPNYRVPERAVAAMAAMVDHRRWRERPPLAVETFDADQARVRAIFEQVRSEGRIALGGAEPRDVLEAYGFATPRTLLARDPEEAARFAVELGFPVVLKMASPDILHKTDVGGVKLNIMTPQDVRDAYKLMLYRANRYVPEAEIWGCLVQEMVTGGKEVLIGMNRDPHFGPLMTFGLGGFYAEALPDLSCRVAPLDRRDAQQMITEIQGHNLLRGVGGERPTDLEALVEAILRLAQLVTDFPEIIEFEISPLTVYGEGQGVIGIDMRLVLA
jgi:acetyltransferase